MLGPDVVADVEIFKNKAYQDATTDIQKSQSLAIKSAPAPILVPRVVIEQTPDSAIFVPAPTDVVEDTPSDEARNAELFERNSSSDTAKDVVSP